SRHGATATLGHPVAGRCPDRRTDWSANWPADGPAGAPECPSSVPADYRGRRANGVAVPYWHGPGSVWPQRRAGASSLRPPERFGARTANTPGRPDTYARDADGSAAATVLGGIAAEVGRPLAATMSELEAA